MMSQEQQALRRLRFRDRFHIKMTLLYGAAVLAVLVVMGLIVYRLGVRTELEGLQSRLLATAVTLATTLDADGLVEVRASHDMAHPTYARTRAQFERICELYPNVTTIYVLAPTDDPNLFEVVVDHTPGDDEQFEPGYIYDASDVPVLRQGLREPAVEQEPYRDAFGLTISGYAPLVAASGEHVGLVGLDVDAARIDAMKASVLRMVLAVFGLAALFLGLAAILVGRSLRRPLVDMMRASSRVASGDLKARIVVDRRDEFGLLGDNFNRMAEGLEEREFIRDTFGRYMSEDVARTLLEYPELVKLGGEERDVTVLLSDIRGYSTISEALEPVQVVELLNEYLGAMNAVIDDHRGCVIEYLGDAILAVFGAPNDMPDHAERSVRCALAMRQRLEEMNEEWKQTGLAELWKAQGFATLTARVGLHSGNVVAGNLGSKTRMKYAVTGDTVNVAARLEQLNKEVGTEILLSDQVFERLPDDLKTVCIDQGAHTVKGRDGEIVTYSL